VEQLGLKKALVLQIRHKFGDTPLPFGVSLAIVSSDEEELLDMIDRIWKVKTLEELAI
jgi:hypothetical protein